MSGKLLIMANDSKTPNSEQASNAPGTAQMIELMENEVERLKANLELIRASDAPNRRALIKQHVDWIDERSDALEDLRALRDKAESQG